ncbi:MAG: ATP-binding cassette domain-containing protein [Clostridiales Family XIII bacterium]|nr:ATP-binding cassette domain-containing protein [Clostridiales Family XIII bacterium]
MIEIKNLVKRFGEVKALNDLSFTVKDGVAFGLLGRNGAGKTTCIRIIMEIFAADSGSVRIRGIGENEKQGNIRFGYLPEERGLYQKRKISEQMIYIGMLRGLSKTEAIDRMNLLLKELEAEEYLNRKLDTLSKGNQQKIQLAIALINDPDIVILDEPFSGLDPVNAQLLKNIVRKQADSGKTVIFSSHQMPQVEEFCDDICIINKGTAVLSGNLDTIKRSYPRNTLLVETGLPPTEDVLTSVKSRMEDHVSSATIAQKCYAITLKDDSARGALFEVFTALGQTPEKFIIKEPSLEEIFVEKVGDPTEDEKREEAVA